MSSLRRTFGFGSKVQSWGLGSGMTRAPPMTSQRQPVAFRAVPLVRIPPCCANIGNKGPPCKPSINTLTALVSQRGAGRALHSSLRTSSQAFSSRTAQEATTELLCHASRSTTQQKHSLILSGGTGSPKKPDKDFEHL